MSDYILELESECCTDCHDSPCDPCTSPAACCMYPWPAKATTDPNNVADYQLAPPYTPDDLPAEVLVEITWVNPAGGAVQTDTAVLSKGAATAGTTDATQGYSYGGTASSMQTHDPDVHEPLGISLFVSNQFSGGGSNDWIWCMLADSSAFAPGQESAVETTCLESDYKYAGGGDYETSGGYTFTVKDRFADHYMVNTVLVTRISACQWQGTSPSGVNVLLDYSLTTAFAWSVLGVPKDPEQTQSSPEGAYDNGGITVAAAS